MKKYLYCFRAGKPRPYRLSIAIFILLLVGLVVGARSSRPAYASETTVYLGSIEKTIETGEVKIYIPAGSATVVRTNNKTEYLYADHLGSTVLATKDDGTKEDSLLYYPYGNQVEPIPPIGQISDKLYTGQRKDESSDLYFYHARYYNPKIGNFISADKAEGPNRYAYVGNNPLMRNDPSGNEPIIGASGVYGGTMGFGVGSGGINYLPDDYISRDEQIVSAAMLGGIFVGGVTIGVGVAAAPEMAVLGIRALNAVPPAVSTTLGWLGIAGQAYGCATGNGMVCVIPGTTMASGMSVADDYAGAAIKGQEVADVTGIYGFPKKVLPLKPYWENLHPEQERALGFLKGGDITGAWQCLTEACARNSMPIQIQREVFTNAGKSIVAKSGKPILLAQTFMGKPLSAAEMTVNLGHEVGHNFDTLKFGLDWRNSANAAFSEARQYYWSYQAYNALGNTNYATFGWNTMMRIISGKY